MNHNDQAPSSPQNDTTDNGLSRRDFLRRVGAAALYVSAAPLIARAMAAKDASGPAGEEKWSAHRWGMAIDVDKCIGCGQCVVACKEENGTPKEPFYFRTWVERYRQFEDETVVDSPNGAYDGFPPEEEERTPDKAFFVPKLCNACDHSPCVQVCPVGATFETPDGAVLVDNNYCIGCRYCIQACPYGTRFLNPVTGCADKCTFCYHRIHRGLQPACVDNCPTGARLFGDLKDRDGALVKFLKEKKIFVLKPHLNTFPKVFYHGIDKEVR